MVTSGRASGKRPDSGLARAPASLGCSEPVPMSLCLGLSRRELPCVCLRALLRLASVVSLLPFAIDGGSLVLRRKIVCGIIPVKRSLCSMPRSTAARSTAKFGARTPRRAAGAARTPRPGARSEHAREGSWQASPSHRVRGQGAARRDASDRQDGLPKRHGRHAAQLPLPGEFGIVGRQLRPLHRVGVQQRTRGRRPAPSLPGRRGEALLHHAPGRIEGLLLRDLRQF